MKGKATYIRTQQLIKRTALWGIALIAGVLVALPSTTLAKGKPQPYKIKGTSLLVPRPDTPATGIFDMYNVGEATYFGRYSNIGWLQFALVDGEPVIVAGEGTCVAANGKDYSNWHMEPFTGRVIFDGADEGRFAGEEGYFDSTTLSLVWNPDGTGVAIYIGTGELTFAQ
jgi:hypothetical protein